MRHPGSATQIYKEDLCSLYKTIVPLDFPLTFSKRTLQYADFVEVKNDRFSPCFSLLLTYGRKMILETPIFCPERTFFSPKSRTFEDLKN